jgi:hypothetical protein
MLIGTSARNYRIYLLELVLLVLIACSPNILTLLAIKFVDALKRSSSKTNSISNLVGACLNNANKLIGGNLVAHYY